MKSLRNFILRYFGKFHSKYHPRQSPYRNLGKSPRKSPLVLHEVIPLWIIFEYPIGCSLKGTLQSPHRKCPHRYIAKTPRKSP